MIFCPYLVRDINFEPDAIQPCCNIRNIQIPRFLFQGGKVAMSEYCTYIEKIFNLLQDGNICNGCPELTVVDVENSANLNILFHTVSLNMHRWFCNCKCIYCDFHKQKLPAYSILPAIKSLYAQHVLHKNCFFSWGGGESTILREFEDAATLIYNYGFKQYIHTNALHYSHAVAALLEKCSAGVNISLDSGSQKTYKIVKGIDGFQRVTANIGKYIAASKNKDNVVIKYIIFNANNSRKEIVEFFALCKCMGIENVEFSFDFREVNSGTIANESLHAAILFIQLADRLKIKCSPFFVDDKIIAMMENIVGITQPPPSQTGFQDTRL